MMKMLVVITARESSSAGCLEMYFQLKKKIYIFHNLFYNVSICFFIYIHKNHKRREIKFVFFCCFTKQRQDFFQKRNKKK